MFGKAALKLAAIGSSLLLVGGFVSYRAGAFDRFFRPATTEVMGGSKSREVFGEFEKAQSQPPDDPASAESEVMMFSSKSSLVISEDDVDPTPAPPSTSPPPSDRIIQAGSKSMMIDLTPPAPAPNPEPDSALRGNGNDGPPSKFNNLRKTP